MPDWPKKIHIKLDGYYYFVLLYFDTATKNSTDLEAICLNDTCNLHRLKYQSIMNRYS